MIKNYTTFIKESLLDKISGPSDEEIFNNLKQLSDSDRIRKIIRLGKKYYFSETFF